MASWGTKYEAYTEPQTPTVSTGTVFRCIPFPNLPIGESIFARIANNKPATVPFNNINSGEEIGITTSAHVSAGIVLTPDCDIYQHKVNTLIVAQILSIDTFITVNGLTDRQERALREEIVRAKSTNPGSLNRSGIHFLPQDTRFDFEDSFVIFSNHMSIPIRFTENSNTGQEIVSNSVGGNENFWFRIGNPELKIRLVNEFARHILRIGLPDL